MLLATGAALGCDEVLARVGTAPAAKAAPAIAPRAGAPSASGAAAHFAAPRGTLVFRLRGPSVLLTGTVPHGLFPGADANGDDRIDAAELHRSRKAMAALARARLYVVNGAGVPAEVRMSSVDLPTGTTSSAATVRLFMEMGWARSPRSVVVEYRLFDPMQPTPLLWRVRDADRRGGPQRSGVLMPPKTRAELRVPPPRPPRRPVQPEDAPAPKDDELPWPWIAAAAAVLVGGLALRARR